MKIRPLFDRVVVKRVQAEEKSVGGIIIPGSAQKKPQEAEVVAVGPGLRGENGEFNPLTVKVGDKVLFGKFSGTEITLDGEDHLILREEEILGVIS